MIQNGQSVKLSVKVQYPNILVYGYATCQFMVIHTISNAFVSACMLNTNDDLPIADDIIGNDMIGGFGYRSAGLFENGGTDITPTAQPAFQPTPAPATGWVYSFINYGSQCDTESSPVARGYSVDACLTSIDQSWRYSCDSRKYFDTSAY